MSAQGTPKTKAVDLLHRAQILPRPQYEHAVALLQATSERAEDVLIDNEILSEADLLKALSGIYRTHFVSAEKLSKADIPRATVQMIPRRVAETLGVFPVLFDRQTSLLSVVTPDPDNADMLREVKLVSGARDVKAFVARPAAVAAAIRKHHAGDVRAFERFERAASYDFGQQVLADGRVMTAKETARRNTSTIDGEMAFDRFSMAPAQRRSSPDADELARGAWSSASVARTTALDFDAPASSPAPAPAPPPLPTPRAPMKSAADVSLSAPPPPPPPLPRGSPRRAPALPPRAVHAPRSDTTIELLTVMVGLLENTRQELRGHSSRVAHLLRRVAEPMNLGDADMYALVVAGHTHDLGKMGQFHLTALNCSEYEGHRLAAQKAFDAPPRLLETVHLPPAFKEAVLHMYERFDGKGFPDKLAGEAIPLGARLLAVADTYADLTQSPRNPFRKVLEPAAAMDVLYEHQGTIFDPAIVARFKGIVLGKGTAATHEPRTQRSEDGRGGGAKGVSGSLRGMGLPDIVQVLVHGRKTGKLNVKSGGSSGEIHFLDGAIANAVLGKLTGAAAFYAMVCFQDGEFSLDPSFVPPKRLVAESAEVLLLEAMRRMDEGI